MEKFFTQHFYSLANLKQCYLSPYCQILGRDDGIILKRADIKKQLFIPVRDKDAFLSLFEKLINGMELEELAESLNSCLNDETDAREWMKYAIQGGMIE